MVPRALRNGLSEYLTESRNFRQWRRISFRSGTLSERGHFFSLCNSCFPLPFSSLGSMFESLLPPTCQMLLLLTLGVHVQTSSLSSSVSSQLNLQTPTSEDTRTGKKYFPPKGQREEDESWGTYSGPQKSLSQIHLSFRLPFILSNQRGNKKTKKMCAKTWI